MSRTRLGWCLRVAPPDEANIFDFAPSQMNEWLRAAAPLSQEVRTHADMAGMVATTASDSQQGNPVAAELRALGVKGILVKVADLGQLRELKCEMPQCYHAKGRASFDPAKSSPNSWAPSADHYPILKSAGGKLTPGNVRLAHVRCNHLDHVRRTQIRKLLDDGQSLADIADSLNRKSIPPAHGTNRWTAAMVRKSFVS